MTATHKLVKIMECEPIGFNKRSLYEEDVSYYTEEMPEDIFGISIFWRSSSEIR